MKLLDIVAAVLLVVGGLNWGLYGLFDVDLVASSTSAAPALSPFVYAAVIGGLVLVGTVINLVSIPHPTWFAITSVVAIVATVFVTSRIAANFVPAIDEAEHDAARK